MPEVPCALDHQCLGGRRLEVCTLPSLLSPGFDHLERTILSSARHHDADAEIGRDSLPVRGLPLQFRQLQAVQREVFMAQAQDAKRRTGYR